MSRDKIIQMIHKNVPAFKLLPEYSIDTAPKSLEKLKEAFRESLLQVGAKIVELNGKQNILLFISNNYPEALDFSSTQIWNEYSPFCSKEKLAMLETVVLVGQFGVAENGAIWLDCSNFPNPLVPFITTRLVIILDSMQIVGDMQLAYNRINLENTDYGVFMSGPSKTADIEQSLVYGAHGPKELIVILY